MLRNPWQGGTGHTAPEWRKMAFEDVGVRVRPTTSKHAVDRRLNASPLKSRRTGSGSALRHTRIAAKLRAAPSPNPQA